jgi:hypothetical protein
MVVVHESPPIFFCCASEITRLREGVLVTILSYGPVLV